MDGEIRNIIHSKNFATFIIWINEAKCYGRTYTGLRFRNFLLWKDLKIGDKVTGLSWKEEGVIIDADSPVHPIA